MSRHGSISSRTLRLGAVTAAILFAMVATGARVVAYPAAQYPAAQRSADVHPAAAHRAAALPAAAHPSAARPAPQDDFPTTAGEARRYYEGRIDDWTSGPVEAVMTSDEYDIWEKLEDTDQRERFIEWFWDRRDADGRRVGNDYQEEFYEQVAHSNLRFRGFPRGWKSDRGRVRIILGKPDRISHQTYAQLGGIGSGPDFEIWGYSNIGNNRAFRAAGGEFAVYFAETRIGDYEVYDFRWGAGVWDRNIRTAFELAIEGSIIDPIMPFEAGEARGDFVREITEGTLPVEIPTGVWSDLGAGNMVSVPVQIRLGDLLFQPHEGEYVASLDSTLTLRPRAGGDAVSHRQTWEVRLSEADLLETGNGSLATAVSVAAPPGAYQATLVVSHPLAVTEAQWSQDVSVTEDVGTAIVIGQAALPLSATDTDVVSIVMSADGVFAAGAPIAVGAWMRGAVGDAAAVSVQLEAGGGTYALEIEEARWLGGEDGPLLVLSRIPDLEAGEYLLTVDFGADLDAASVPIEVRR